MSVPYNELRSMRQAISRRIDRALKFSARGFPLTYTESIKTTRRSVRVYRVIAGCSPGFRPVRSKQWELLGSFHGQTELTTRFSARRSMRHRRAIVISETSAVIHNFSEAPPQEVDSLMLTRMSLGAGRTISDGGRYPIQVEPSFTNQLEQRQLGPGIESNTHTMAAAATYVHLTAT